MKRVLLCSKIFFLSAKKSIITTGVMVLLASLCLNMLFVLLFDYTMNFDRIHQEQNGEDNVFIFSSHDLSELKDTIREKLDEKEGIEAYDLLDVQYFWGGCKYGEGTLLSTILPAKKTEALKKSVGKYTIISEDPSIHGVYLPYSFNAGDFYHIGDDFTVTDNTSTETVRVAGFYYSTMTSSQNCYMITLIFDDDVFAHVSHTFADSGLMVSVRGKDPAVSKTLDREFPREIKQSPISGTLVVQNMVESVKQSRYVMYTIAMALIGAASVILLIQTSVSLNIYLSNYVRDRKKVIGILKAIGYTDSTISKPIIALFLFVAAGCSVLGIAAFYGVFPALNRIFEAQIGLPYEVHFLPLLSIGTLLILLANITIVSETALHSLRKVSTLNAIRATDRTKSMGKQLFSLKETKLPLNFALSLNDMFSRKRQTVVVVITMLLVSFNLVIMLMLFNIATMASENLTGELFGESCDISAVVPSSFRDAFIRQLSEDEDIANVVSYDVLKVDHDGGQRLTALIIGDGEKLLDKDIYYEGCYPRNEHEIAIGGKYAEENHIAIGDTLTFSIDGTAADFTVCGFSQSARYLGNDCTFTLEGYERMTMLDTNQCFIALKESVSREEKVEFLRELPITLSVSDVEAYRIGTIGSYVSIVKAVSLLLAVLCLSVMLFVIYHLSSDILKAKEKAYGIMKALGFTTKDLMIQTISEISIPIILAAVIGLTGSCFLDGPLLRLFTYRIGIVRNCFEAPTSWVVISGFLLILLVLLLELFLSLKIRKLVPKKLLGEK